MTRRAGAKNNPPWDVLQVDEVDIVSTIDQLRTIGRDLDQSLEHLLPSKTTELLQVGDEQTILAVARQLANTRDQLDTWTRVLAELGAKYNTPKRALARELGISTSTLARWLEDPVGFNWADVD